MDKKIEFVDLLCAACIDSDKPELPLVAKPSLDLITEVLMKSWNAKPRYGNACGIFIDVIEAGAEESLNSYFASGSIDEPLTQRWLSERYENAIKPFIEEHKAPGDLENWTLRLSIAELP